MPYPIEAAMFTASNLLESLVDELHLPRQDMAAYARAGPLAADPDVAADIYGVCRCGRAKSGR